MANEGDLWDDSALINAFNHAISSYKKMHITERKEPSSAEDADRVIGENGSDAVSENLETKTLDRDAEKESNIAATDEPDSDETIFPSKLEENHPAESQVDKPCVDSTSGQDIRSAQGLDDYNRLIAQYYELEVNRRKVLEQLNQYGGWNYQYAAAASSSAVPYSYSQDYSMYTHQFYDPNVVCTCCPSYTQCSLAPCTSAPGYLGGSCVDKPGNNHSEEMDQKILFSHEDGKLHKIAMGAAEKALSSIKTTVTGDFNGNEEKERKTSEPQQTNGPETDLSAVLNAWYSAGFYTGKYLVEQSIGKRRQN